MEIIDAHTHIQFSAYDADRREVMRRAKEAGVKMIAVGTQAGTSRDALLLAREYPEEVWAAVGFHPNHARGDWHHDKNEQAAAFPERFDPNIFRAFARDPKTVAIGECGLDYYRLGKDSNADIAAQKEVFRAQIEIARECRKPLMIHCRPRKGTDDAYEDLRAILPSAGGVPVVIHFHVGSRAVTEALVADGCYFTFGGVVTFVRDYDAAIAAVPMNRMLVETDAPYVAPVPHRGARNEPAYVWETVARLAALKGLDRDAAALQLSQNAREAFGF